MRIHFDNVNFKAPTGPNVFAKRLASQLTAMGHDVVSSGNDAQVSLVFIERTGAPLAETVVQRLDGIWFSPNDFWNNNFGIWYMYNVADAVIMQSSFDKMMVQKWYGERRMCSVIHNGVPLVKSEVTLPMLKVLRSAHDRVYVCAANWHPQKRLRANIELFKRVRSSSSCLVVLGTISVDQHINEHGVVYYGSKSYDFCSQVYAMSDWMFHLAWADHCPNTVVEALAQSTPVVCSEAGGTAELVGGYGLVLKEKKQYCYELADYEHPPDIDVSSITLEAREELDYGSIACIDIRKTADEYLSVFTRALEK